MSNKLLPDEIEEENRGISYSQKFKDNTDVFFIVLTNNMKFLNNKFLTATIVT